MTTEKSSCEYFTPVHRLTLMEHIKQIGKS